MRLKVNEESKTASFQLDVMQLRFTLIGLEDFDRIFALFKAKAQVEHNVELNSVDMTAKCKSVEELYQLIRYVCKHVRAEYLKVQPTDDGLVVTIDESIMKFMDDPAKPEIMMFAIYGICCTYGRVIRSERANNITVHAVQTENLVRLHTELDNLLRGY